MAPIISLRYGRKRDEGSFTRLEESTVTGQDEGTFTGLDERTLSAVANVLASNLERLQSVRRSDERIQTSITNTQGDSTKVLTANIAGVSFPSVYEHDKFIKDVETGIKEQTRRDVNLSRVEILDPKAFAVKSAFKDRRRP